MTACDAQAGEPFGQLFPVFCDHCGWSAVCDSGGLEHPETLTHVLAIWARRHNERDPDFVNPVS